MPKYLKYNHGFFVIKNIKVKNMEKKIEQEKDKIPNKKLNISDVSCSEKKYSVDDIHNIIKYINKNYSKIEDELAKPYENKGEDLPNDFFDGAYNLCFKRAIESIG